MSRLHAMDDHAIFTPEQRERIRDELVTAAKTDARLLGAAHLGSAAIDRLDRWSDIDMALCLADAADLNQVLLDWTSRLYRQWAAITHHDVKRGNILYRVFLLDNTLQIDLSFWRANEFRAMGDKFRLIFGDAGDPLPAPVPNFEDLLGMAWLYALHVRSSISRMRLLQAEYMLSGMRDNVLALACQRCGVAAVQGRGLDDLPQDIKRRAEECLASSTQQADLVRAFRATMTFLIDEIREAEPDLARRLAPSLEKIIASSEKASAD